MIYSLKKGNVQLSKNFKLSEFACKDGSDLVIVDSKLVLDLQTLRDKIGKAINITSAYRSPAYNKQCGGIEHSEHIKGKAADIQVAGVSPLDVAKKADALKLFNGIGVYPTFTHLDIGDYKGYWYQDSHGKKTFYKSLAALEKAVFNK
ncbi:MAG: D-Ala-D-Ala carboxypeptidase family metallohydrolase [Bacteroidota bacterium]|nr:D-Ala-D-Ala carboxypeptidase family metallohydrolase [Bacteroidota bacterium]